MAKESSTNTKQPKQRTKEQVVKVGVTLKESHAKETNEDAGGHQFQAAPPSPGKAQIQVELKQQKEGVKGAEVEKKEAKEQEEDEEPDAVEKVVVKEIEKEAAKDDEPMTQKEIKKANKTTKANIRAQVSKTSKKHHGRRRTGHSKSKVGKSRSKSKTKNKKSKTTKKKSK